MELRPLHEQAEGLRWRNPVRPVPAAELDLRPHPSGQGASRQGELRWAWRTSAEREKDGKAESTERQRDRKRRSFRGRLGDWMQAVCTVLRVFFIGCLDRECLCLAHTHTRDIVQSLAPLLPEHRCVRKTGVRPD